MAHRDFFSDAARARAAEAVKHVEKQTSAEIVVTVRAASDRYRDADLLVASLFGFVVLLLLLFLPQPFDVRFMPVDVAFGFFIGWAIASRSDVLRRLVSRARTRNERVETAAKAAFVNLGVSRTRARTGILVYVSMLEKRAALVPDIGITAAGVNDAIEACRVALTDAVATRDFATFITKLETLGPALCTALPCGEDDINELGDEVRS